MWTARAIRFLPELLLLSFLIHHLGEQSYGIYVLAWSVLPILALLQQSIGSAVIKYSAAFLSQSRIGDVNRVLSTSCLLSTIFGTVGGLVPILVANFAPSDYFEKISHGNHEQLIFALNGVGIMIMLTFPLMPYAGILYALQRYDLFALVKTVGVYVRAGAIVCWFLFVGRSIEVLVIVSAVTEVLSGFCLAIIAYRLVPGLRNRLTLCNLEMVKTMFGFGTVILLCSVCSVINTSGIKWIMAALVSPAFVAVMAVMLKPPQLMVEIVQAMSLSVMPAASKYSSQNNYEMLRQLFVRGTRYMTMVVIVGVMAVLLLAKPVLEVWMGAEYQYLSIYVIVLCGGAAIWMSTSCVHHMLRGMGMLRSSLACAAVGPVVVALGTILLILWTGGSAYWALVWGLTFGQVVAATMRIGLFASRTGVRIKKLLWNAYGQPVVIAAPVTIFTVVGVHYLHLDGLAVRTMASVMAILVFAGFFGLFFLTQQEKQLVRTIFQSVRLGSRGILSPNG